MRTPEGDVKKDVKKYLTKKGYYFFMPVQTGYGKRTLDFLICSRTGYFIAAEAKRKGKKGEAFQLKLVKQIKEAGGHAFVFDSFSDFMYEFYR